MKIEHYLKFKELEEKGIKKESSKYIREFISSFEGHNEIEAWVWEYLPNINFNRNSRIRHEIFHELVFPVLKLGYERADFKSTLWLGKLIQNIYQSKEIHQELGYVSELEIFEKCFKLEPENNEARLLFVECIISWLRYSEHEWPSGILYGNNGATLEECKELSAAVQQVLELDKEHKFSEFIKQYNKRLTEYRTNL